MEILLSNPAILCFLLGVVAAVVRSDLKIPDDLYTSLTIYLLLAIGLKGGVKLTQSSMQDLVMPLVVSLSLGILIPCIAYFFLKKLLKFSVIDAAALSAHYGSVSVVTFAAALAFVEARGIPFEGFMISLLALLEVPGILVGLLLAKLQMRDERVPFSAVLHELLVGRSILLLAGGMVIGATIGAQGFSKIAPLFEAPFGGVLCIFLLEMGIIAGRRLSDIRAVGGRLVGFALVMPLISAALGILGGVVAGLSPGGVMLFAVLCASASYIAAPAAVRMALPTANSALYITAALAITFPFNVLVGIPLIHWVVMRLGL